MSFLKNKKALPIIYSTPRYPNTSRFFSDLHRKSVENGDFTFNGHDSFLRKLQTTYDNIQTNPNFYPLAIQRMHKIALEIRSKRTEIGFDQSILGAGNNCLSDAPFVLYVIFTLDDPSLILHATRNSCFNDFMRLISEIDTNTTVEFSWLRRKGLDSLLLYPLECLNSKKLPFKQFAPRRLHTWRQQLIFTSI